MKKTTNKNRFSLRQRLLTLYLSIGTVGVIMLIASVCFPAATTTASDTVLPVIDNPEHIPNQLTVKDSDLSSPNPNQLISETKPTPIPTSTPSPTPTSTPSPTPTPANDLLMNAYPEVNQLVEAYYTAKLTGEISDYENIVSDVSLIQIELEQKKYELVKEMKNYSFYTKKGIDEIAYVVFVSYDAYIVTIDTPIPHLDRLTLVYSEDKSKLLINVDELTAEQTVFIDELDLHEDVIELRKKEEQRFDDAVASDEALKNLIKRLYPDKY